MCNDFLKLLFGSFRVRWSRAISDFEQNPWDFISRKISICFWNIQFFKSEQYLRSYCWLKLAVLPLIFACTYEFSWKFAGMYQICLTKISLWYFPCELCTSVNQGHAGHNICVCWCINMFEYLISRKGQQIWSSFFFYLQAIELKIFWFQETSASLAKVPVNFGKSHVIILRNGLLLGLRFA